MVDIKMVSKSKMPTSTAFAPGADGSKSQLYSKTRSQVLEGINEGMKKKEAGKRLQGKVGIITGVGPQMGIGANAAKLMAREGAKHLYLLDYSKQVEGFAKELSTAFPGTKVTALVADAASSKAISDLVDQALDEEGHLDFFFANAGVTMLPQFRTGDMQTQIQGVSRRLRDVSEEEFAEVMRVNALSVFLAIKYAPAAMAKICPDKGKTVPGGSIILTASVAGLFANAGPIPYSASKAAVRSMAQTASYELTGQNVRVNAICPGLIQTDMTKLMFEIAKMTGKESKMGALNPLMRQGLGSEVAQAALFLASDDSSYINGQSIVVDGGLTAGAPYPRGKL